MSAASTAVLAVHGGNVRQLRACVIFHRFGPYHAVRLLKVSQSAHLLALELSRDTKEYCWSETKTSGLNRKTLFEKGDSRDSTAHELCKAVFEALDSYGPDCVIFPGWSERGALAALLWCGHRIVPAVAMSESSQSDEPRLWWKEWVKGRIVSLCSAALVGGRLHADYMVKLGQPRDHVFLGYDAVDNDYFRAETEKTRAQPDQIRRRHSLPENYFLAAARFISKKNLPGLIDAYARYRALAAETPKHRGTETPSPWDLVLLGDGPLRPALNSQLSTLNLQQHVYLPGFKQYPDLPANYGLAKAFIHASTTEQWGLVVNEAMASGLPVLVSNRCGCAPELVQEGVNGYTFDPYDVEGLAQLMFRLSNFNQQLSTMGQASQRIIAEWGPERFASGLKAAAEKAIEVGPKRADMLDRFLLRTMMFRRH